MNMPQDDAERARAREDLCRFLSACYYEPDAAFAEERLFDSMLAAAARIDPELAASAQRLGEAFAALELEALLVDYTRLFLGPPEALARPYGSFWLSGDKTVMQDSTMAVLQLYRQGGFDVDGEFTEVPDHIAAELEFLYLLTFRENRTGHAGLPDDLPVAELRRRFLGEHLGAWADGFTTAVTAKSQTGFYRELAALTQRFLAMERAPLAVH
jgi:putative dimethyl sulfoxide reductase chaperone